jgi:hypothetical protein
VFELVIFVILSVFLECGMGIVYGVGIGYAPLLVFPAAVLINFFSIIIAVRVVDRLLEWKKGFRCWLERRLARGQKLIDKYGCVGIVVGVLFLSPMQLAIMGRLLGIKPGKLYPALFAAILIVATAFLGIALGIFKILLA